MLTDAYLEILTIDEAAEALRIGRGQCYELLKSGRLKSFKLGSKVRKIPRASINEFIRTNGYTK